MRQTWLVLAVSSLLLGLGPGPAEASEPLEGVVVEARARWVAGGSRIVTESTLVTDDGRRVALRQLGGSVDGIGMRVIPAAAPLRAGDRVRVTLSDAAPGGRYRVETVDQLVPNLIWFVRTLNDTGAPLYWKSGCVFITFDTDGTTHIPTEMQIMQEVLDAWSTAIDSCSYLQFVVDAPTSIEVGFDRTNVIKFRENRWCRPETEDDPEECYDESAAGLTTLFFIDDNSSDRNGEILDADIELNAVSFSISDSGNSSGDPACLSDLRNTLTHEVGHLLGLDHTCWVGVGTRPTDSNGDPVPSCNGQLPSSITEATMYNFQDCGETRKATLEADDIAGVCGIYPSADDPGTCEPVPEGGGCCSASPDRRGAAGALALALLCLVATVRRRPSR